MMQPVDRNTFVQFTRKLEGVPVESSNMAAMQYVDGEGRVVATATYSRIDEDVSRVLMNQGVVLAGPSVSVRYYVTVDN